MGDGSQQQGTSRCAGVVPVWCRCSIICTAVLSRLCYCACMPTAVTSAPQTTQIRSQRMQRTLALIDIQQLYACTGPNAFSRSPNNNRTAQNMDTTHAPRGPAIATSPHCSPGFSKPKAHIPNTDVNPTYIPQCVYALEFPGDQPGQIS